jgi:hypothetical protein
MKMKKLLIATVPVIFFITLLYLMSSFTTTGSSIKVSCQFSPVSGDFANVELENCNSSKTAESVAAGSSFTATLVAAGCQGVNIATSLPAIHPAGTIKIYKNGVLQQMHVVAQNQPAVFFDGGLAKSGDQFLVTW